MESRQGGGGKGQQRNNFIHAFKFIVMLAVLGVVTVLLVSEAHDVSLVQEIVVEDVVKDTNMQSAKAKLLSKMDRPGDLPIPPPLAAKGDKPIKWEKRLKWALTNCVKVRSAADSECNLVRSKSKAHCADVKGDVKLCAQELTAAREKCRREHHQAFHTCSVLWNAARSDSAGKRLEVTEKLFTRRARQLHLARAKCGKAFAKQQHACSLSHKKAHISCMSLHKSAASAEDKDHAAQQAHKACAKLASHAEASCKREHDATTSECGVLWQKAQAVATPDVAAVMKAISTQAMSKALVQCRGARQGVMTMCRKQVISSYKTCRKPKITKEACTKATKKGQEACRSQHRHARSECQTAYEHALKAKHALMKKLSVAAAKTANLVATEARAIGIPRGVAKESAQEAASQAMVAVAHGKKPPSLNHYKAGSLQAARHLVRKKMLEVVSGVRKVWKKKVKSAVKAAAAKAAQKARQNGKSAAAAEKEAVAAAKAAAKHLQRLAEDAELQAGAKAMGPEVKKLVMSPAEQDRKRLEAMAQPYMDRADKIMKQMNAAEAKVEAAQAKKRKAERAKARAQEKEKLKERVHKRLVKTAAAHVRQTTDEVLDAGAEVSKVLSRIADQAAEAAEDVHNTQEAIPSED
jgi:hypothetical protein